ncbi:MAG TPA: hypothetical protein PLX06_15160, partial [Fimbriimonadaceae bacterium]|nr:hypothetical protein [Fimbriimonadaceae bacterium]
PIALCLGRSLEDFDVAALDLAAKAVMAVRIGEIESNAEQVGATPSIGLPAPILHANLNPSFMANGLAARLHDNHAGTGELNHVVRFVEHTGIPHLDHDMAGRMTVLCRTERLETESSFDAELAVGPGVLHHLEVEPPMPAIFGCRSALSFGADDGRVLGQRKGGQRYWDQSQEPLEHRQPPSASFK